LKNERKSILAVQNHFTKQPSPFGFSRPIPRLGSAARHSAVVAFAGGLSILLGYCAKPGAWLIVLFLIPVTLMLRRYK
jgi:putative oxidoreductase